MMLDPDDAVALANALGVAQRRVVRSLSSEWGEASDHRTAKRMVHGVRDAKGLIEHQKKMENSWRLTELGQRVRAVLDRE